MSFKKRTKKKGSPLEFMGAGGLGTELLLLARSFACLLACLLACSRLPIGEPPVSRDDIGIDTALRIKALKAP